MSRKCITEAVIRHLQQSNYKFLRILGKGGFAHVIAVRTPDNEEVAIKIVEKRKIWIMEDSYWQTLIHPNLLPVKNTIELDHLNVKLYIMPIAHATLHDVINGKEFKNDVNAFNRLKKWLLQISSALEFLHDNGFCHSDLKADNILIDSKDDALLADFSGLNFTKFPLRRFVSPYVNRPPEYFTPKGYSNIRGELCDMWAFGILALNTLTGHYYHRKTHGINGNGVHWWSQLLPILNKALEESKFEKLLRKSFPKANLTGNDIRLSRHFIQFVMKISPEFRPGGKRVIQHLFLKSVSNPFMKNCYEMLYRMSSSYNPFKTNKSNLYPNGQESVSVWNMDAVNSLTETSENENIPKGKKIGKNLKSWFLNKLNKDATYNRLL